MPFGPFFGGGQANTRLVSRPCHRAVCSVRELGLPIIPRAPLSKCGRPPRAQRRRNPTSERPGLNTYAHMQHCTPLKPASTAAHPPETSQAAPASNPHPHLESRRVVSKPRRYEAACPASFDLCPVRGYFVGGALDYGGCNACRSRRLAIGAPLSPSQRSRRRSSCIARSRRRQQVRRDWAFCAGAGCILHTPGSGPVMVALSCWGIPSSHPVSRVIR